MTLVTSQLGRDLDDWGRDGDQMRAVTVPDFSSQVLPRKAEPEVSQACIVIR